MQFISAQHHQKADLLHENEAQREDSVPWRFVRSSVYRLYGRFCNPAMQLSKDVRLEYVGDFVCSFGTPQELIKSKVTACVSMCAESRWEKASRFLEHLFQRKARQDKSESTVPEVQAERLARYPCSTDSDLICPIHCSRK